MRLKALLLILLMSTFQSFAQFQQASFMIKGNVLPYQILFPKDYDSTKKYPLTIFLHGAGERGNDNDKQLTHGKDFLINNFESKYPSIVIVPQCPADSYWSNVQKNSINGVSDFNFTITDQPSIAMESLVYLIDYWLSSGKVNLSQVYVGGLSMGAMGTYELLWRMPNTFSAAFAICGGGNIQKVSDNTQNTALWIFHGSADSVVSPQYSQEMYSILKKENREVKYTEYPNVNHNSWDNVFQNAELVPWLFSHKR